jgi:hypothetical protein
MAASEAGSRIATSGMQIEMACPQLSAFSRRRSDPIGVRRLPHWRAASATAVRWTVYGALLCFASCGCAGWGKR